MSSPSSASYGRAMTASIPVDGPAPRRRRRELGRSWLAGWPAVVHLLGDFVLAAGFLLIVAATVGGVLGAAGLIGLPILVVSLSAGRLAVAAERWRLAVFTGRWLPYWPSRPPEMPWWRRQLLDTRPWRAQLYLLAMGVWGLTGGLLVGVLLVAGLTALVLPWLSPDAVVVSGRGVDLPYRWLAALAGANALLFLPWLARMFVGVDIGLGRALISTNDDEQVQRLTDRVDTLTQTRAAALDSVEAERRRIERDLHDGPQQRLVAVAMELGLARRRLAEDPAAAAILLERAHDGAKEAITEMRRVARGIHPPVLTDRGLDAALSALATRSVIPVSMSVTLPNRPTARLEAIAYFSVSEALTNVAKHSQAGSAWVTVSEQQRAGGAVLVAEVRDNGVGGADSRRGSGLIGLADRVAAVDGTVTVASPPGGPTVVTIELPMAPRGSASPSDAIQVTR